MAQQVALGFVHGTSATSFLPFASMNSPPDSDPANDDAPPSERSERAPAAVVVAVEHADPANDAAAGFPKLAAHLRFTPPERSESAPAAVVVAAELADPAKPGPAASKSITPAGGVGGIAPPSRERCNPARISGSQTAT